MSWELLITAAGLALVIEGLPYFLFPKSVKNLASQVSHFSPRVLQILGLVNMTVGLVIIYIVRKL